MEEVSLYNIGSSMGDVGPGPPQDTVVVSPMFVRHKNDVEHVIDQLMEFALHKLTNEGHHAIIMTTLELKQVLVARTTVRRNRY